MTVKFSTNELPFESTNADKTPLVKLTELIIGKPVGTAAKVDEAPITVEFVIKYKVKLYDVLFVSPVIIWEYEPGEIEISKVVLPYDKTYLVLVPPPIFVGSSQDKIMLWFFGLATKLIGAVDAWYGVILNNDGLLYSTPLWTG